MDARIDHGRLGTYLNDHLGGATAGVGLARRLASQNEGTEYGAELEQLAREIEQDREILKSVIAALNLRENPFKKAFGHLLERAGMLKWNGSFTSYSPLSRLLELEGLMIGAMGKRCLWQTLELLALDEPALRKFDFADLQTRAGRHVARLGRLRLEARMPAFAETQESSEKQESRTHEEQRREGAREETTEATPPVAAPSIPGPPLAARGNGSRREIVVRDESVQSAAFGDAPGGSEKPVSSPLWSGTERRSGRERRMDHILPPSLSERRSGEDRRGAASRSRSTGAESRSP